MGKKAPSGNSPALPPERTRAAARANPLPDCPMAAAFAAVGGKWKLTLVYWLAHGETALPMVESVRLWGTEHLARTAADAAAPSALRACADEVA